MNLESMLRQGVTVVAAAKALVVALVAGWAMLLPPAASAQAPAVTPPPPAAARGAQAGAPAGGAAAVAGEYRLALGDTIRISVFQSPDLSLETRITESGSISYPLLGTVSLVGMTVPQAEKRIADGLRDGNFIKQPQVSINVVQVRGNLVSVLGQVSKPGRYPLEAGDVRLTDIIAAAGGILPTGHDIVIVTGKRNGEPFRHEVDMTAVFGQGRTTGDVALQNGDVVYVERAPQVYVYGEVQRPGALRLERGMSLMQAIAASGGLTAKGTMRRIQVHRKDPAGKTQILDIGLTDGLQADDVVNVRESFL
jgi:polysaccharide export outer membrane protein